MTTNLTSIPHAYPTTRLTHHDVHRALNGWHNGGIADSGLDTLYLFQRARATSEEPVRAVHNQLLRQALEQLAQSNTEFAEILQLRFLDNLKAEHVANQLNLASSTFYDRQKNAIEQLTTILCEMDRQARHEHYAELEHKLPRQHRRHVIGINPLVQTLQGQLCQQDSSWIFSVEGIGGIGKTTVAGQLAHTVIQQDTSWANVAWVTASPPEFPPAAYPKGGTPAALAVNPLLEQLYRQLLGDPPLQNGDAAQLLAALEAYLQRHKCLIIIDNLETLADVEAILPTLRRLIRPSKFILTSRHSFYTEGDVYHVQMAELKEADALQLVRNEARSTNLLQVVEASDEQLRPIFATVGGNPLALRLIVGQLHIFDLAQVLDDLMQARGRNADRLYTYIFRRAWDYLDEPTRHLLIAMLLTRDGGDTLHEIARFCGGAGDDLAGDRLRIGLRQLLMLNLVEGRGGLFERRYAIHQLTRSFLHRQVGLWQEP